MNSKWVYPLSLVILVICFVLARFPVYYFFPNPMIYGDGVYYYGIVYQIKETLSPDLSIISPGYPLIIILADFLFQDHILAVPLFQSLLTFFSVLIFLYAANKTVSKYYFLFFIAAIIYVISDTTIKYEISLFPDSIISSFIVLIAASILPIITHKNTKGIWNLLFSFTISYSILIRSSQIYLLIIWFIIIGFCILSKKEFKQYKMLIIPIFIILFSTATYNWFKSDYFSFLSFGRYERYERRFSPNTSTNHEEKYLWLVENIIPKDNDLYLWEKSTDLLEITNAYINIRASAQHGQSLSSPKNNKGDILLCYEGDFQGRECLNLDSLYLERIKQIENKNANAFDSIFFSIRGSISVICENFSPLRKKPHIIKNSFFAFLNNHTIKYDQLYYSVLQHAYERIYMPPEDDYFQAWKTEKPELMKLVLKDKFWATLSYDFSERYDEMKNNHLFKLHDLYINNLVYPIVKSPLFLFSSISVWIISVFLSVLKKLADNMLNIITIIGTMLIGVAATFAIFSGPLPRYSHDIEFLLYQLFFVGIGYMSIFLFKKSQDLLTPFSNKPLPK